MRRLSPHRYPAPAMPWRPEPLPSGPGQPSAKRAHHRTRRTHSPLRLASRQTPDDRPDHRPSRPARRRTAARLAARSRVAILQHGEWIRQKLDEWRTLARPRHRCRSSMGCACRCSAARSNPPRTRRQSLRVEPPDGRADAHPLPALARRGATRARAGLRDNARALFAERLAHYAPLLGVGVPRLSLSAARTRWGSCSQRTGIRLNWRLIHFPPPVVDYVVAHEVAHLREMNHSPSASGPSLRGCTPITGARATN
jgi:predicted metal-dependent hydrolase